MLEQLQTMMPSFGTLIHHYAPSCTIEQTDDTRGNVVEQYVTMMNQYITVLSKNDDRVDDCGGTVDNTDLTSSKFDGQYNDSVGQNDDTIVYYDRIIWNRGDKIGQGDDTRN